MYHKIFRNFDQNLISCLIYDCQIFQNRVFCYRIVVQKEGPNKGRPFFGCSKPADARCQFFMWADQPADDVPASQGGRSTVGYVNMGGRGVCQGEVGV